MVSKAGDCMSERIPPKLYAALGNEIKSWAGENIISEEVAQQLIARYPASASRSNAVAVLTIIGAVLVGLGTLLYIGANWKAIATLWKLAIIATAIVGAHFAGWKFRFEPGLRPRLGEAFMLLGSLFFGSGIWLIAQMFNIDVDFPNGLLLWFCGTAASAMVTRSVPVGILSSVILAIWTCAFNHLRAFDANLTEPAYEVVIGTLTGLAGAWYLRSRAMTWITLLSSSLFVLALSGTALTGLLLWGFALFGAHLWIRDNAPLMQGPFKYVGVCSVLGATLAMTGLRTTDHNLNLINFSGLLCAALAALAPQLLAKEKYRLEALGSLLLIGYFMLFQASDSEFTRAIAFNFMMIASIFGLAFTSLHRLRSPGLLNTAITFAVLNIICRYFDIFFSMMDRSVFFIIGGIVLMAAGAAAERGRRTLMGSMQS